VNFDVTIIKELLHKSLLQQLTLTPKELTLLQTTNHSYAHNLASILADFSESLL
jgi:hypothetical protein